jgi:hypothetical protein
VSLLFSSLQTQRDLLGKPAAHYRPGFIKFTANNANGLGAIRDNWITTSADMALAAVMASRSGMRITA